MSEYIELNMNNYGPEDVDQLNQWGIEASERIFDMESAAKSQSHLLRAARKTRDMYQWCLKHNVAVLQDQTTGEWWSYDVDGDRIDRGKDIEEACWGAYDFESEVSDE